MLRQTKAALASTGLRVHDIELARVYEGLHPTKYLPAMEVAAELGAKAVLSSIWGGEREFYIEKFGEICDLAKPFGLTVDLEYVPIATVSNLAQSIDVLRAAKRSNAGLMIDTHHFHRARDNPADLDVLPREWFHFAQLCDASAEIPTERAEMIRIMREGRLYCGEGGIDVAGILAHVPPCVYSIELPNKELHEELGYAEHATRCLETLKAYLAGRGREARPRRGSRAGKPPARGQERRRGALKGRATHEEAHQGARRARPEARRRDAAHLHAARGPHARAPARRSRQGDRPEARRVSSGAPTTSTQSATGKAVLAAAKELRALAGKLPVIFTCRSVRGGGERIPIGEGGGGRSSGRGQREQARRSRRLRSGQRPRARAPRARERPQARGPAHPVVPQPELHARLR